MTRLYRLPIASFLIMGISFFSTAFAQPNDENSLRFDPQKCTQKEITLPNGETIHYRAYERIYYVTNIEDSAYQFLNIYIPDNVDPTDNKTPIFLRTYVGGYMSAAAMEPSKNDATGRALQEGYIVCIPGSRGWDASTMTADGKKRFTGRAPATLIDLKAAVRYLRYNDDLIPGDAEKIITDGTSAGGAMSALLGTTGNHPDYDPYLHRAGAANARDDIFAAVCFCPIIDLEHADMAYEWMYRPTNGNERPLSEIQRKISEELANAYPDYLNSLNLKKEDGTPLTDKNYLEYIKTFLVESAQKAKDEQEDIPENAGIILMTKKGKETVKDIQIDRYLNYIVSKQALKTPPAFDQQGVSSEQSTPENCLFGDVSGNSVNFTLYSLRRATGNPQAKIDPELQKRIRIMNPMNYVQEPQSTKASYWYIRHGALDRDTSFPVPINLATLLRNSGYSVDFALPWNRPHTGDYRLDELFNWIRSITQ